MFRTLVVSAFIIVLQVSCSSFTVKNGKEVAAPIEPLACIVVLPVGTSVDRDKIINFAKAQSLEKGAAYATGVLTRELGNNPKVHLLTSQQLSKLVPEISGGLSGTISALGRKIHCDGVLITTIRRFRQRKGSEYAADAPASVIFNMVLRNPETGKVLWTADYRETQSSFLSNIFSFAKVRKRGLKWMSAEQLLDQAISERLAKCRYLQ